MVNDPVKGFHNLLFELLGKGLVGAEIGVYEGDNLREMLNHKGLIKKIYAVDSWVHHDHVEPYLDATADEPQSVLDAKFDTVKKIAKKDKRVVVMHMTSEEAAGYIDYGSLDFVFIDANHNYVFVKQDVELWSHCVHVGGMIAGHDYNNKDVEKAVTEVLGDIGNPLSDDEVEKSFLSVKEIKPQRFIWMKDDDWSRVFVKIHEQDSRIWYVWKQKKWRRNNVC